MKVIDLGPKAIYRWRVEVPWPNTVRLDTVENWIIENNIRAAAIPGLVFFSYEKDATMFILRWS